MFWHGRAWLKQSGTYNDIARLEWMFGKLASGLAAYVTFGAGEDERGIMFHVCLPFVFSFYLTLEIGFIHAKERRLGFAVHNDSFWLYIFDAAMGDVDFKNRRWFQRYYCWNFPWQYDWYSTEILKHWFGKPFEAIHIEKRGDKMRCSTDQLRLKEISEKSVQSTYDYTYRLKNGTVQHVKATIHVMRMTWLMRWWPLLPFKKVSTSIDVKFSEEVGEGTGSWKGGCVGCGYTLLPDETPYNCLRRMESERKFGR